VVICIADGSHFARERPMAFTLWHPDAVSGSHPPHLLSGTKRKLDFGAGMSESDPFETSSLIASEAGWGHIQIAARILAEVL
jgi:hypothetical protein